DKLVTGVQTCALPICFVGDHHQLGTVVGVQLGHSAVHVGLGGVRTDHQVGGDVLVGHPGGHQLEDLPLPVGQVDEAGGGDGTVEIGRASCRESGGVRG